MKPESITTAMLGFLVLGGLGISTLCTMPVSAAEEAPRRLVVTGIGEATVPPTPRRDTALFERPQSVPRAETESRDRYSRS